ncbi:hypothetical protein BT96DRAFT_981971, partial [Gymnopus androsaceus JB14]
MTLCILLALVTTFKSPNVYINCLPLHYLEDQLFKLCSPFGEGRSMKSFTRHVGKKESKYGFVLFEIVKAAKKNASSLFVDSETIIQHFYSSNSPAAAELDYNSDDGFDLESEASDFRSIPFDLIDPDGSEPDPTSPSSSFSIPAFLRRLFLQPPSEFGEVQSESEDRTSGVEDKPLTGLAARRKWKKERKRDKWNVKHKLKRKLMQDELGTTLKEISRKKAACPHTISTNKSFSSKALPINSGGWSGLQQKLEKINPAVQELLDKHDMQITDWDRRQSYAVVDNKGRIITALAGTPDDPNWIPLMQELAENIRNARDRMSFSTKQKENKR